jgi:hypothetical protein
MPGGRRGRLKIGSRFERLVILLDGLPRPQVFRRLKIRAPEELAECSSVGVPAISSQPPKAGAVSIVAVLLLIGDARAVLLETSRASAAL